MIQYTILSSLAQLLGSSTCRTASIQRRSPLDGWRSRLDGHYYLGTSQGSLRESWRVWNPQSSIGCAGHLLPVVRLVWLQSWQHPGHARWRYWCHGRASSNEHYLVSRHWWHHGIHLEVRTHQEIRCGCPLQRYPCRRQMCQSFEICCRVVAVVVVDDVDGALGSKIAGMCSKREQQICTLQQLDRVKLHQVSRFLRFKGAGRVARRFPAWIPVLPLRLGVHHGWLWQHGVWKCFCHRLDRWHRLSRWGSWGGLRSGQRFWYCAIACHCSLPATTSYM